VNTKAEIAAAATAEFLRALRGFPEFEGLSARNVLQGLGATLGARGPPLAFTIDEFCTAHRISRSGLYKMWARGIGPRVKRIGVKVLITAEAAAEWRAAGESSPTPGDGA
jgi:hypothetical protein